MNLNDATVAQNREIAEMCCAQTCCATSWSSRRNIATSNSSPTQLFKPSTPL